MSSNSPRSDPHGPGAPGWWRPALDSLVSSERLDTLLLAGALLLSRWWLHVAGLRVNAELSWMFIADADSLRERLWHTLHYFHAFPPGLSLLTGVVLKLGGDGWQTWAGLALKASGLLLALSTRYCGRQLGLSRWAAIALALAISLLPASLFFEHLYLYTHLTASLLCAGGALLHWAVVGRSAWRWFLFFLVAAALCIMRSTFHLVWLGAVVVGSLMAAGSGRIATVLRGAAVPGALVVSLYVKNLAVFGFFGATSWTGANYATVTTHRLPREVRKSWINNGSISPFAGYGIFTSPERYVRFFRGKPSRSWPTTTDFRRPSVNAPNYNHWYFIEMNRAHRRDALYYLRHRPLDYVQTVFRQSLPQLFHPATHWHPQDGRPGSPHFEHRRVLGKWESWYDRWFHHSISSPEGLYVLTPLLLLWALAQGWSQVRREEPIVRARGWLLLWCWAQSTYVVLVCALLIYGESARYRYLIEPLLWIAAAAAGRSFWRWGALLCRRAFARAQSMAP